MPHEFHRYYERFKELPETARLLAIVTALGLCSLYVLGLVSLIAGPRLRQAPVAYAEAVIYVTSTPTYTATPEPTEAARPTDTPAPTATPAVVLVPVTVVEVASAEAVEPTPTQRSYQPIPTPTEPRVEPSATPTRVGGKASPTPTRTATKARGGGQKATATATPRKTPPRG